MIVPQRKKRGFLDERDAKRRAKELRRKPGMSGSRLRPYRCPLCPKWHLTSQPKDGTL